MQRRVVYTVLLWLTCFILMNCRAFPPHDNTGGTVSQIRLDEQTGTITIKAKNASLFQIFRDLEKEHHIEITIPDLSEDRLVTVDIRSVPLHEGLEKLIPADLKYWFNSKNIEVVIAGNTGEKKPLDTKEPKPLELPIKDKTTPLTPKEKITVKVEPEQSPAEKHTDGEGGTKIHPSKSEGIQGKEQKISKERIPEKYRYARLNLFIDSSNKIKIERFLVVEGKLIESKTYNGTFLYAAYVNDDLVSVGSMQDPLLVRSLGEQPGRLTTRAKQGYFSISLPSDFLNREKLSRAKIRFYLVEEGIGMPEEFTPQTFTKIEKKFKPSMEIDSDELLETYLRDNR